MDHEVEVAVYSQAKREARYYGITNPSDCQRLEASIRYRLFRQAIEPYERFRNKPLFDFLRLQTKPIEPGEYPDWLKEHLAQWNGMIASEAKKYGYEQPDSASEERK